tara:strand:- start:443 stop:835 length:393 start_codon:yes stop_codon:yes gene_type:complete
MTPQSKIKWAILEEVSKRHNKTLPDNLTEELIGQLYAEDEYADDIHDTQYDFRGGQWTTDVPEDNYSRHYECQSVAAQMPDGSYVGWLYWTGGGKHGEPEGIDWIPDAYNVECVEEEKMVVVRKFSKGVN